MTLVACGDSSDARSGEAAATGAPSALTFKAQVSPLADFKFDTGLMPQGSPAQVQLKLSAGGGLKVEAAAEKANGALAGKPGGGKLSIDIHMKLEGRLKVDSTFKSYDGELPGLKDIDIPLLGSAAFDGLLLEAAEAAEASADLPETTLPEIPLGSIPGSLVLTIATGSKLTSKFHGTCLSVAGGQASYAGQTKTSGSLVMKGKIVLKLPTPLDKSIDLPDFTVPIPEVTTATASAPLTISGVDDAQQGSCGAAGSGDVAGSSGSPPGSSPAGGSSPGGSGGGSGTPAPACVDPDDAPDVAANATSTTTTDGVDTVTTVSSVLNGAADVDYHQVTVTDSSFGLLQPNITNATTGAELCAFVECLNNNTTSVTCSAGTAAVNEVGAAGCCVSGAGAVTPTWDCVGTIDESSKVSFRVKNRSNACVDYSFSYVF